MEDFISSQVKKITEAVDSLLKSQIDDAMRIHGYDPEGEEDLPELTVLAEEDLPYKKLFINYGKKDEALIALFTEPEFQTMFDKFHFEFRFWVIPKDYFKVK